MSGTSHLEGLSLALNEGRPVVLLLGQDAWNNGSHPDPVLVAALKRSQRYSEEAIASGIPALLDTEPLAEDFYDWLAEAYLRQPESPWMETVACLPLNAVFTTSIDPALARAFRVRGRDVEAVLSTLDYPAAPRHRRNLHITYLFGRAGERNVSENPPRSTHELRKRTALHANPLLSRIVDTTSSLGILLVDGLTCGRDWLGMDALYGVLGAFSPGQVYWFGWGTDDTAQNQGALFQGLAAPNGPIVFVRERLSVALQSLELAHKIDLSAQLRFVSDEAVTIGDHVLDLDPAIRLKTSTAASIIDDAWLAPLAPLGPDAEYIEFRRFHGYVEDASRLVDGIRRGFAIERTFEHELNDRVHRALINVGRTQEPYLIHGQSGSGKSLALARLAHRVREQGKYPVLLGSRVSRMPAVDELDEFCLRAEDVGAPATLLVCDANAPASRYRELLRGFISRGRRVVVVGSTYRIVDRKEDESLPAETYLLEVPADLNDDESKALVELIGKRTGITLRAVGSKYLLPAIYRMLPDVRPRLAAGLAREAQVVEDDLRARGSSKSTAVPRPAGALGQALVDAGLVDPKALLDQTLEDFLGSMSDAASKAIDFVMVPGKLNCPVPINLLMRAVGGIGNPVDIVTLFSGIDLFRWNSDDEDEIFVHPRLQIEAELISARRLGTSEAEAEVAIRLLTSANPTCYGSGERRFVLDLVHRLGPDGPFGRRYAQSYLKIARALTEIRTSRGITDPSLMLQEATLRRRVLRDAPSQAGVDRATLLEEARQVVDLALDEFGGSTRRGLRRMCANLKVERAAIYGFRALERLKSGANLEEVWQFYEAARDSARSAVIAADTYVAIDVSVWGPTDLLREGNWSSEKRAELIADIWDGLERVDAGQLDPDQRESYEIRRVKVAQTLNDNQLEHDALDALNRLGSRAGVFLQARMIGGSLWGQDGSSAEDVSRAKEAVEFMKDHWDSALDDVRCLRYVLRALWLVATKNYLFGGERSPLPERRETLEEILSVLDRLDRLEGALGDPRTQYLRAVFMWRLQREHAAREVWRSLSQETAFSDPRRIVRHHLWTESGGQPRLFHGRITADNVGRGHARVQVEEIRQEIDLHERDFPQLELKRGAGIPGGFYIAFNYIGPVAEPPKRRGGGR